MFLIVFPRRQYGLYCVIQSPGEKNLLRVDPSLLDVAIFMRYPQMSEMFLIIFPRGQFGLYSVS